MSDEQMSDQVATAGEATSIVDTVRRQVLVPVIRTADVGRARELARGCVVAGLGAVELTETIPEVDALVEELTAEGVLVGVGTVAVPSRIASHVAAGARFVVSYAHPPGFLAAARAAGVTGIPAALTPTEVLAAVRAGAPMVKLFPASETSPRLIAALRSVGLTVPLMPTGGIPARADAITAWLDAGAHAIGLGGDLTRVDDDASALRERIDDLLAAVAPYASA